jgi:type I restriction enzyme S subunit
MKVLEDLKIPIPPIELQNKFSVEVEKFEKIRESQEKSLKLLNELFEATLNKSFKGEL